VYDEQERTLQRQEIELHDRVKRFERQFEVLKQDQPVIMKKKKLIFSYLFIFRKIMIKNLLNEL
jgi:hypothetical protein